MAFRLNVLAYCALKAESVGSSEALTSLYRFTRRCISQSSNSHVLGCWIHALLDVSGNAGEESLVLAMQAYSGSGGLAELILNLGTKWGE